MERWKNNFLNLLHATLTEAVFENYAAYIDWLRLEVGISDEEIQSLKNEARLPKPILAEDIMEV